MSKHVKTSLNDYLNLTNENNESSYILYHGTSSDNLNDIKSKPSTLYLTDDENVAAYYAAKGGENYFMEQETKFEKEYGITPDEYYNTEENGEIVMFKALYPKDAKPIVIKFIIPINLIDDINKFQGYKGGEMTIDPKYINQIIEYDWDDFDY